MKEMKIKISPDGQVKLYDIKGPAGGKCLEFTEDLEKGLGEVVKREFTEDYYKEEYNQEFNREKQGQGAGFRFSVFGF